MENRNIDNDWTMDNALIHSQLLTESVMVDEFLKRFKGYENLQRAKAMCALDTERKYQEDEYEDEKHTYTVSVEIILMRRYLDKLEKSYIGDTIEFEGNKTMDIVREIIAIGLRCMENHGVINRGQVK